ncbi:aromatic acid/H+ symport family MFS transporter [Paraburkholderia jirisanensis]
MPQTSPERLGVEAFVDAQPLARYHGRVFVLCALCLMFDGFDAQAMGYVAPALRDSLQLSAASLGPVFSASLFGMLLGALGLGMLADRVGRRPVLVGALAFCGVLMYATAGAHTVGQLLAARFVTGLGLGTLLPTALAVTTEFSPARQRSNIVMLMSLGFVCGAAGGGTIASWVVPQFGWQTVFTLAGGASLLGALALLLWLPESIQFVAAHEAAPYPRTLRIARGLSRNPQLAPVVWFSERAGRDATPTSAPRWTILFRHGFAPATLLLWLLNFANLLDLYFLSNWLPTLLKQAGLPLKTALIASAVLQSGGIPATVLLGWLTRRAAVARVLLINFMVGALAMAGIGLAVHAGSALLFAAIFVAGFCVVGGQSGVNALGAQCYPAAIRSTGMGWASGIGRFGSVAGPLVGSALLSLQAGVPPVFFGAATAGALAALAVLLLGVGTLAARGSEAAAMNADVSGPGASGTSDAASATQP